MANRKARSISGSKTRRKRSKSRVLFLLALLASEVSLNLETPCRKRGKLAKMRLPYVAASLLLASGVMGAATPAETTAAATFQKMAETALNATLAQLDADVAAAKAAGQTPNCTRDKLQYRYEL